MESVIANGRLVCGGLLTKYPNLRFISHHCENSIVTVLGEKIDIEFERFMLGRRINWGESQNNPF
jgi:hypothetical protein